MLSMKTLLEASAATSYQDRNLGYKMLYEVEKADIV